MIQRMKLSHKLLCFILLTLSYQTFATETDFRLHIHVHYQQELDTWKVRYNLPVAVNHVAFERGSNFDRKTLYKLDDSKFIWDKADDVLLIRSIDGNVFDTFELTFPSYYNYIQKDYEHNIKYSDGSVLLYTNHLALGANIIDDKSISPLGVSFSGSQFHFYAPKQSIIFLGNTYEEKAEWNLSKNGTYIYFGNIKPIENDNMIAIVDPALPKWVWQKTQKYFPQLFDFYKEKTDQSLNFKPVVFFNYDHMNEEYLNYSGGTLDGLVQLTINGKRWKEENKEKFNKLFHFLAHESAHFWNGQMFTFEDQTHSWLHEGGADAFANFAMLEFGLIDSKQMMLEFEKATNTCLLNKGSESLAQSGKLGLYSNYYTCGATMAIASHFAVKVKDPSKSLFDIWKIMFDVNRNDRTYNQQDYFNGLTLLTESNRLENALKAFDNTANLNNRLAIESWFEQTGINILPTSSYSNAYKKHWGIQIVKNLMIMHCNTFSFSPYDTFIKTYPVGQCKAFEKGMEIQYIDNIDIFSNSIKAYNSFREKCDSKTIVILQNRKKEKIAQLNCLYELPKVEPYMSLEQKS